MRKIPPPYTDPTPLFHHGGARRPKQRKMLDFSASINPLGPPPSVLRVLREGLDEIAHYPDPECRELAERIAAYHHVDPALIVVGNGSNELIYALARAFRPKRVAIAEPTYTEYLRASLLVGAAVDHWLAEGEQFRLRPFDPEGADLVWLCNPNNPTGQLWPRGEEIAAWIQSYPQTLFVVDEAFTPLCVSEPVPTLLPYLDGLANLVILRSMTKVYALPGLRLGYAVGHPKLLRPIRAQLSPWSVNVLAQRAGFAALEDDEWLADARIWLLRQIEMYRLRQPFRHVGHALPFATNFVLVRLQKSSAAGWVERLGDRGILVRHAANFIGLDERYVRVAVRSEKEMTRLFEELLPLP